MSMAFLFFFISEPCLLILCTGWSTTVFWIDYIGLRFEKNLSMLSVQWIDIIWMGAETAACFSSPNPNPNPQGHKTATVYYASCSTLYQPSEHESPSNKWWNHFNPNGTYYSNNPPGQPFLVNTLYITWRHPGRPPTVTTSDFSFISFLSLFSWWSLCPWPTASSSAWEWGGLIAGVLKPHTLYASVPTVQ